jgi:hypothetical protein
VLTKEQSEILQLLQELPSPQVQEIRDFALFLKERYGKEQPLDESDAWSDEDMHDLASAALRNAEETIPAEPVQTES